MSMIRKIIPVSLYDIPGLEGWLEEQASQGLFPTSLGSWAVFEDRGLPEVLQKLREHRGGRPPPGPAALPPLEQVEHLASFHSNITLPIWCLLEDPLSDSVSELPCSG